MRLVYSDQELHIAPPSIFLAGPTSKSDNVKSWRAESIDILETMGFTGTVIIPERQNLETQFSFFDELDWEYQGLEQADVICFWVTHNLATLPGFITNVEFRKYVQSGKFIYGRPDNALKSRPLDWIYTKISGKIPCNTLKTTLQQCINRINDMPKLSNHYFDHGRLTYVQIPAFNVDESAAFYQNLFGWQVRGGSDSHLSFADSTGDMIGAWVTNIPPGIQPGVIIYIYVHDINNCLERVIASGCKVVAPTYLEGDLLVATVSDPAGNIIGIWQKAPAV